MKRQENTYEKRNCGLKRTRKNLKILIFDEFINNFINNIIDKLNKKVLHFCNLTEKIY